MKTLFLFLAMLFTGMVTRAQEVQPTQKIVAPYILINNDSLGLAVTPEGVGIVSNTIQVVVFKNEGKEQALMGVTDSITGALSGVMVADKGNVFYLASETTIIETPIFDSHADADASLLNPNQPYRLRGDRNYYHKPEN